MKMTTLMETKQKIQQINCKYMSVAYLSPYIFMIDYIRQFVLCARFTIAFYSAPAAKRCLELVLEVQGSEIIAIEKENLPVLNRGIEKGMRLMLIPPMKMSKNVLLLKKRNVKFLTDGDGGNASTERLEERLRENGGVPPERKRKLEGALSTIVSENNKSKQKSIVRVLIEFSSEGKKYINTCII